MRRGGYGAGPPDPELAPAADIGTGPVQGEIYDVAITGARPAGFARLPWPGSARRWRRLRSGRRPCRGRRSPASRRNPTNHSGRTPRSSSRRGGHWRYGRLLVDSGSGDRASISRYPSATALSPVCGCPAEWQVLGSNQRRLSRRFYSPLAPPESLTPDQRLCVSRQDCGPPPSAVRPCAPGLGARPRTDGHGRHR
jgi:hypothetical protein